MDLLEIDGGNATIRLYTDDLRALALACHLAGYGLLERLANDHDTAHARAMLYQSLDCTFQSLACGAIAFEQIPDFLRKEAVPTAVRKDWITTGDD